MKIFVAIPERYTLDAESAMSVANIQRLGHDVVFGDSSGRGVYGVDTARICVAKKAIEAGCDRLLMVDSDIIIPPDALRFLLDPPDSIVLGVYPYKNDSGNAPFFNFDKVDGRDNWKFSEIPPKRIEIKCAGLGCSMIDVGVFDRIAKPWFFWEERASGKHTGEDMWFCQRAREAGYKIVMDGRVRCKHVGRKVYG